MGFALSVVETSSPSLVVLIWNGGNYRSLPREVLQVNQCEWVQKRAKFAASYRAGHDKRIFIVRFSRSHNGRSGFLVRTRTHELTQCRCVVLCFIAICHFRRKEQVLEPLYKGRGLAKATSLYLNCPNCSTFGSDSSFLMTPCILEKRDGLLKSGCLSYLRCSLSDLALKILSKAPL